MSRQYAHYAVCTVYCITEMLAHVRARPSDNLSMYFWSPQSIAFETLYVRVY